MDIATVVYDSQLRANADERQELAVRLLTLDKAHRLADNVKGLAVTILRHMRQKERAHYAIQLRNARLEYPIAQRSGGPLDEWTDTYLLRCAVERLPEPLRVIARRYYYDDEPIHVIARQYGLTIDQVKYRLQEVRRMLK